MTAPGPVAAGASAELPGGPTSRLRGVKLGTLSQTLGSLASLILLSLILWYLKPVFMTSGNWVNILRQASFNAILGMGMTFVILTGGVDLSVGSIVALSSVTGGLLMYNHDWSMAPAVGTMLIAGGLAGLANGLVVTLGRIPPFIVTLGTMQIFRGVALQLVEGKPIFGITKKHPNFDIWGTRSFWGIPSPVIITAVVFAIGFMILRYTRLGLYTYAIGGNEQATRFSGVHINRYKLAVYTLMGFAAGIAGVVLTSRLDSAQPNVGQGAELDAIAAVVIGGTSLFGGEGTIVGTLIGALLMAVIRNGLTLLHVSAFYQQIVIGSVIILAVLIDRLRRRTA
ncbi:MAG: ribose transport system permease protein [Thermomicrobiales bacterium]|jgi:ribose/xylose/arabinose/galactoside ABC-type transport system permease subunit|nr:ribose transport system permease protein [Thermomicrobiales bacterium]MEA2529065.1 ribose transport system permease protein [Thermomicrobiales bacterium]MEA2594234.1 ribose transport system permease protein [Thermomicrobiales bacterium]